MREGPRRALTWKKDASTSRKHRVLKTSPTMLTVTTGTSFFAVSRSGLGSAIFELKNAETCRRTTAMSSWTSRKRRGRSGELLRTALLLYAR